MGGWAEAQSPILGTTITVERLAKRGYESLFSYYEKVSPQLNEPLYTRPGWLALRKRRVQWCERLPPLWLVYNGASTRLAVVGPFSSIHL